MATFQGVDLLARLPWLKRILMSRLFQPVMMLVTLPFFTLVILTGFFGTPAGSRNFGIIGVWIVWWALLIIFLVPVFGRLWCAICPLPAPGEWLQRRAIVNRRPGRLQSLGLRWPHQLKNMWLQNLGFLGLAAFSAIVLTRPQVSAWVLLALVMLGVVSSLLFEKRIFCRYVCPVGGFIGLYSMMAPLALRIRDQQVCLTHGKKDCVTGNERGYGCPWLIYPGNLVRNIDCGLCTECLKTCPQDNITLSLRPAGSDLMVAAERKLDEAYKGFIMLGCALLYSAILLGPWGWLKRWANMDSLTHGALYFGGFLIFNLLIVPALFWLVVVAARKLSGQQASLRRLFTDYAYALIPLGLAAWIAFSVSFVLTNGSYTLAVASDPFGWGWNLLGTADAPWRPLWPLLTGTLQIGVLAAGLLFAVRTAYRIARQHTPEHRIAYVAMLPVAGFLLVVTLSFLGLYLG